MLESQDPSVSLFIDAVSDGVNGSLATRDLVTYSKVWLASLFLSVSLKIQLVQQWIRQLWLFTSAFLLVPFTIGCTEGFSGLVLLYFFTIYWTQSFSPVRFLGSKGNFSSTAGTRERMNQQFQAAFLVRSFLFWDFWVPGIVTGHSTWWDISLVKESAVQKW